MKEYPIEKHMRCQDHADLRGNQPNPVRRDRPRLSQPLHSPVADIAYNAKTRKTTAVLCNRSRFSYSITDCSSLSCVSHFEIKGVLV